MTVTSLARLGVVLLTGQAALGASFALADTHRQALAAQVEAAGFHETAERRHEVRLQHCSLTTYVYEDWQDHGKVLWSSFLLNLKDLQLQDPDRDGHRSAWIPDYGDGKGAAIMVFTMEKGSFARHEMAMRRTPKPPYTPSPREGADSYVYKDKTSFFILHEKLESPEKSNTFISLLEQYRLEYCFPLS